MVFPIYERVTLGTALRSIRAGGFIVTEAQHAPNSVLAAHGHQRAHLCFVLEGHMLEGCGRRELDCAPGTLVWKAPQREHWNRFGPQGCRSLAIELESWRLDRLHDFGLRPAERNVIAGSASNDLAHQLRRVLFGGEPVCALALESLALQLIASIAPLGRDTRFPGQTPWLERARSMLASPETLAGGLTGLAARVGVHPVHLARSFRTRFGCTIGEYVRRRKIEFARRLLAESDHSIARIAIETGFADQAHLTRTFRRETGTTPAAFRRDSRFGRRICGREIGDDARAGD